MATFTTQPCNQKNREIRLMTLLPGKADDGIKALLYIVSLDRKPQYEALSYVWGDPYTACTILINKHTFEITENLEAALRQLRHLEKERILWVDAICVNQQDLSERNFQVSLMADIYTGCQLCTAWLGKEDVTTEKAMDLLRSMASGDHFQTWPYFPKEFRASLEVRQSSMKDLGAFLQSSSGLFEPLEYLFNRPWWSRTWIVQELILPRHAVMQCGPHKINWHTISQAYSSLETHLYRCCKHFHDSLSLQDHHALDKFEIAVSALVLSCADYHGKSEGMDMIWILSNYRKRQASDARDKVYAFLSLCTSDVRERFVVSYYSDLFDCYAWPTMDDIEKSRNLRSLGLALHNESNLHLPSWVPDWSKCPEELVSQAERLDFYDLFDAGRGSTALFSTESHALKLWGIDKDIIRTIGDPVKDQFVDQKLHILQNWFKLWRESSTQISQEDDKKSEIPFLRTLMLDSFQSFQQLEYNPSSIERPRRAKPEDFEVCQRWWALACANNTFAPHFKMEPGPEAVLMDNVRQSLHISIAHQRLFISEGGAIGLGPTTTRVGDEVWIVCGGKLPLILRHAECKPPSQETPDPQSCYTLVGSCYVDGFMDGDAVGNLMSNSVEMRIL